MKQAAFVGIDLGTSGCRAMAIDTAERPLAESAVALPPPIRNGGGFSEQLPAIWWQAVGGVLQQLNTCLTSHQIVAIAVDGTSSSLLACDALGAPLAPALMYDDTRSRRYVRLIGDVAPADSAVHSAGSSLAKALFLLSEKNLGTGVAHLLHQSDWILGCLCDRFGVSDENNALKLGYDPLQRRWPDWLSDCGVPFNLLPDVYPPGTDIAPVSGAVAHQLGLNPAARVLTGTTDSTAAALASGICSPGQAVTSLGSTLVMKIVADNPIFSSRHGVYSHRLGDLWLVGGASNSGGAVLERFFTRQQMASMEPAIEPQRPTGLDYYPLLRPGERFPVNDPDYMPRLEPRPEDSTRFFQGMLEGMARIEQQGYRLLRQLGAPAPSQVFTIGGGSLNDAWLRIRQGLLGVPVVKSTIQQAAYGAALLAAQKLSHW